MGRGQKPVKSKEAKLPVARKSPKDDDSRVGELEKRLAEALEQLQTRDRELAEAREQLTAAHAQVSESHEQQTATSEVLRVISSSPTDVQPVFDTIVANAVRLCGGQFGVVYRYDGELIHLAAHHNVTQEGLKWLRQRSPRSPTERTSADMSIRETRIVQVADFETDPNLAEETKAGARLRGARANVSVPMLRDGRCLGCVVVGKREPGFFPEQQISLLETFADQAVIAIENVRLFKELQARNSDLTATSEILRVIASSPTDLQPAFNVIASSALRLCDGVASLVFRYDGALIHLAASDSAEGIDLQVIRHNFPAPPERATFASRVVTMARPLYIADIEHDPDAPSGLVEFARANGFRSIFAAPMRRDEQTIGVIAVTHRNVGGFTPEQGALLKTFADQAVIAIENVRLFTELQASNHELTTALDTQTATSGILRVISRSQTDTQPVFDTILASAMSLLRAYSGALTRVEGDQIVLVALTSTDAAGDAVVRAAFPQSLQSAEPHPQVVRERTPLNIADAQTDSRLTEAARAFAHAREFRSWVVVPLLRQAEAVGAIAVTRREPGGFTDDEIALLKTFADQAVIAIENVRLFKELQARNAELTDTLAQQTATGEVLRAISRAQTDAQPVFDIIAESAQRLCGAGYGQVALYDGALLHMTAFHNVNPEGMDALRRRFPAPADRGSAMGRALQTRAVVQIPDVLEDPAYAFKGELQTMGFQSLLVVPMLRKDEPIGAIAVGRPERGVFPEEQIELLQTFADQAVIAIENVRLFNELQSRTQELTRSVDQLTALGEISRAVSSTLDVETVLDTIVARATQLAGADGCAIYEYDDPTQAFHVRATHSVDPRLVETLRAMPLRKGEGVMGRATETREPIQLADIAAPGVYQSHLRDVLIRAGYRALLSVPLLREEQVIGSLSLNRKAPGEFPPEVIEVLKTFATQSVLAIQNARLFREIEVKSRQLEAASQHKSEFLANMSHELRTPLNAIIGFSEVLAEKMFGEINEKQTEYLQDILESGRHLLSLINDILDLSKIEAGRMELELSEFDLPNAIENALILVRERASRRGIKLGSAIDERLGVISGDERKVKQVLLNLLSNALKFTPEGGRIDVGARLHDGVAEVSVADTGIGIAPADQDAVFEEFRQVGAADKKAEGTGLGLTLCRKFIELHGGRIHVKSQVGVGSTFTFMIPVRRGE